MLKLLLFSVFTLPGVWCQYADPGDSLNQLLGSCLSDEACARHLSDAASNSTNGTNGTAPTGAPSGLQITVAGQANMSIGSLISALAKELDIDAASIQRTGKSSTTCLKCRRLLTVSFTIVFPVPDNKTPEALVQIIQDSDLLDVTTVNIAAGTSTASATASSSYVALPNNAASVSELTDLKTMVNVDEDFVISAFVGIRGLKGYDPGNTEAAISQWSMPIFVKVAMYAWANGLVWTPPPVKANFSLRVVMVDQCAEPVKMFDGEKCKMPYNMDMVSSLYLGNPNIGLPRSRAVVGGNLFTEKLAYLSSLHETPTVGFIAQNAELSDKTEYPSFVRTNTPEVGVFKITGLVLKRFGFTTVDSWFCNTNGVQAVIALVTEMYNLDGFRTTSLIINPFQYTGCAPGSESDIRFLTRRGQDPNETLGGFTKKENYDGEIARALEFNAHVHVNFISNDCAKWDAFGYFAMKGLIGAGHFWTGRTVIENAYEGSYLTAIVYVVPAITGMKSDFVYQKPMDGSVFLDATAVLQERTQYQDFAKLLKYIGAYPEDFLEPWMAKGYFVEAYNDFETGLWRTTVNVYFMDALAVVLFAMNAAVLKYGVNFTDAQLLTETKNIDFEGVGRRVRFDANGDALYRVRVTNYRYAPGFKEHTATPMGILYDIAYYEGTMTWLSEPVFYDGTTEVPPDQDKPCAPGTRYLRVSAKCEICPAGTYTSRSGQAFCDPCPPGTYSDINGTKVCKPCGVGTVAKVMGSTGCLSCDAGMYADSVQMSECKYCLVGFESQPGATLCNLCKRGTYSNYTGASNCTQCPGRKTTFDVGGGSPYLCVCDTGAYRDQKNPDNATNCIACPKGLVFRGAELKEATSIESCKCLAGTYRDKVARDLCHPCPKGMFCEEGSDEKNFVLWIDGPVLKKQCMAEETRKFLAKRANISPEDPVCKTSPVPVALQSYMTREGEPLRPFKCLSDKVCPGGPPGTCGDFADGSSIACGNCVNGARKSDKGCKECVGDVDKLPFIFVPIAAVIGLAIYIWSVNKDKMMETKVVLSFGLLVTIAISTLQTMAMFRSLTIQWFEPLSSIVKSLEFLQFNPEVVKPTCTVDMGVSLKFLGRQLIPVVVCFFTAIIVLMYRFVLKTKIDPLVMFTNAVGTIFYGLFISMISNSFTPFVCYQHPDSSWSMLADASVLCWTTDVHKMMIGVAVALFLIVPVPYLAVVLWATRSYSRFCLEGARGNNRWLLSFKFLFHRFSVPAYYYTPITMVRGLLICLTPVVIAKDPVLQLCILGLIIATVTIISSSIRPWKARSASSSEAVLNMCLLLLIICGAASEEFTAYGPSISAFATFIMFFGATTVSGFLLHAIIYFVKPTIRYDVSICCNTQESAAQSRLLKLYCEKNGLIVCMPHLGSVDEIFDVTKHCVKNLVVLLTRNCLRQPLCCGQIAIAHCKKGVKIVGLKLKGYVAPTVEELDNLPGYLDVTDISLGQMSINWEMVQRALKFLVVQMTLLDSTTMSTDPKDRCSAVIAAVFGKEAMKVELTKAKQNMVLIAGDVIDEDAAAAVGIVVLMLNSVRGKAKVAEEDTYTVEDSTSQKDAFNLVNTSRAAIIVLSKGSLQNRLQLYMIKTGMARMLKNGSTLDSSRLAAFKESRKSTVGSSMSSALSATSRPFGRQTSPATSFEESDRRFEVIPVVIDGFVHPTETTYINCFHGVSNAQLDCIKTFFERMTFQLVMSASDQIVQRQVEMLARIIPSIDDTNSGSFAVLLPDDETNQSTEEPLNRGGSMEKECRMIVV